MNPNKKMRQNYQKSLESKADKIKKQGNPIGIKLKLDLYYKQGLTVAFRYMQ